MAAPAAFQAAIDVLVERYRDQPIDKIIAAEARGFLVAVPLALQLQVGFSPVRKPGKLPYDTHSYSYDLEYGSDTLEMHTDSVEPGQRVLIVDDLLATGGTVNACCQLLEKMGAEVAGCAFLIELKDLDGAAKLTPHEVFSVIEY